MNYADVLKNAKCKLSESSDESSNVQNVPEDVQEVVSGRNVINKAHELLEWADSEGINFILQVTKTSSKYKLLLRMEEQRVAEKPNKSRKTGLKKKANPSYIRRLNRRCQERNILENSTSHCNKSTPDSSSATMQDDTTKNSVNKESTNQSQQTQTQTCSQEKSNILEIQDNNVDLGNYDCKIESDKKSLYQDSLDVSQDTKTNPTEMDEELKKFRINMEFMGWLERKYNENRNNLFTLINETIEQDKHLADTLKNEFRNDVMNPDYREFVREWTPSDVDKLMQSSEFTESCQTILRNMCMRLKCRKKFRRFYLLLRNYYNW